MNEDDRACGRGGVGAVAGNKNLKAIVIKSKLTKIIPSSPEEHKEARKNL